MSERKQLPGSAKAAEYLASTALRDFAAPSSSTSRHATVTADGLAQELPLPEVVRYSLLLIGLKDAGRGDKIAWYVPFSFDGRQCAVALQKFGLRVHVETAGSAADAESARAACAKIVKKLRAATAIVERMVLEPFGLSQVRNGDVTIVNQSIPLRASYEYFREGCRLAFAGQGRHPRVSPRGGTYMFPEQIEGFYNLVATISAYMSLLEHICVLAFPFLCFDPERDDVASFIGERWGLKYQRLFDVRSDSGAKKFYDDLHGINETWRNTFFHGGFDKNQATIYFHAPGIGAVSAALTDIRDSPHFQFVPARESDFHEVVATFDLLDNWLRTGPAAQAMQWIDAGLDVQFDSEFRRELLLAQSQSDGLERLIKRYTIQWERMANMEW